MSSIDKNELLLEYYNIICNIRNNTVITDNKIDYYNDCISIIASINNKYDNDKTIEEFILSLQNALNNRFNQYDKLNISIITKLKILYRILFPLILKDYELSIIKIFDDLKKMIDCYRNLVCKLGYPENDIRIKIDININNINDIINDFIFNILCESIKQLDIENMEDFKNIINTYENSELSKLKFQYDELLIELDKKEKRIQILESEIFPFAF